MQQWSSLVGADTGELVGKHGSHPLHLFFLHNVSHGLVSTKHSGLHFFGFVGSNVGTGSVGFDVIGVAVGTGFVGPNVTGASVGLGDTGPVGLLGLLGFIVISAQFQNFNKKINKVIV